jgi:hypothetical protein
MDSSIEILGSWFWIEIFSFLGKFLNAKRIPKIEILIKTKSKNLLLRWNVQ